MGVEVARSSAGISLCQRKSALNVIAEAGLLGAKPASVPIEQNHRLALAAGLPFPHPDQYRRLVGRSHLPLFYQTLAFILCACAVSIYVGT